MAADCLSSRQSRLCSLAFGLEGNSEQKETQVVKKAMDKSYYSCRLYAVGVVIGYVHNQQIRADTSQIVVGY